MLNRKCLRNQPTRNLQIHATSQQGLNFDSMQNASIPCIDSLNKPAVTLDLPAKNPYSNGFHNNIDLLRSRNSYVRINQTNEQIKQLNPININDTRSKKYSQHRKLNLVNNPYKLNPTDMSIKGISRNYFHSIENDRTEGVSLKIRNLILENSKPRKYDKDTLRQEHLSQKHEQILRRIDKISDSIYLKALNFRDKKKMEPA